MPQRFCRGSAEVLYKGPAGRGSAEVPQAEVLHAAAEVLQCFHRSEVMQIFRRKPVEAPQRFCIGSIEVAERFCRGSAEVLQRSRKQRFCRGSAGRGSVELTKCSMAVSQVLHMRLQRFLSSWAGQT